MILGIDGGAKTGLALIDRGNLIYTKTVKSGDVLSFLSNLKRIYNYQEAVIEKPSTKFLYARHFTKGNKVLSEGGKIRLAQNVGMNQQIIKEIVERLESMGIIVLQTQPRRGMSKWDKEYWKRVFNCGEFKLPSEHVRDAAILARAWENKPYFIEKMSKEKNLLEK